MAKIGRNDPCPCGSGKKYKRCCAEKVEQRVRPEEAWLQDPEWLKIRRTEGEVVDAVLSFAAKRYGKGILEEAFLEFSLGGEYDARKPYMESAVIPWFLFNWIPGREEDGEHPGVKRPQEPLALTYLRENGARLDDYKKAFIRGVCNQPFSFLRSPAWSRDRVWISGT